MTIFTAALAAFASELPTTAPPPGPQTFQRPYLSAGHAPATASAGRAPMVPSSAGITSGPQPFTPVPVAVPTLPANPNPLSALDAPRHLAVNRIDLATGRGTAHMSAAPLVAFVQPPDGPVPTGYRVPTPGSNQ